MLKAMMLYGFLGAVALFGAIQLVPYGHDHNNPPVLAEPSWDSQQTRQLAARACFDCHSNQTQWPWYSNVAPISWLVVHDVREGRETLNFSEWNRRQKSDDAAEVVQNGKMPPWYYTPIHPQAQFASQEQQALTSGLRQTLPSEGGERRGGRERGEESGG